MEMSNANNSNEKNLSMMEYYEYLVAANNENKDTQPGPKMLIEAEMWLKHQLASLSVEDDTSLTNMSNEDNEEAANSSHNVRDDFEVDDHSSADYELTQSHQNPLINFFLNRSILKSRESEALFFQNLEAAEKVKLLMHELSSIQEFFIEIYDLDKEKLAAILNKYSLETHQTFTETTVVDDRPSYEDTINTINHAFGSFELAYYGDNVQESFDLMTMFKSNNNEEILKSLLSEMIKEPNVKLDAWEDTFIKNPNLATHALEQTVEKLKEKILEVSRIKNNQFSAGSSVDDIQSYISFTDKLLSLGADVPSSLKETINTIKGLCDIKKVHGGPKKFSINDTIKEVRDNTRKVVNNLEFVLYKESWVSKSASKVGRWTGFSGVNHQLKGDTNPLIIACEKMNIHKAKLLIDHGHRVNEAAKSGWTPSGYYQVYKTPLSAVVDILSKEIKQIKNLESANQQLIELPENKEKIMQHVANYCTVIELLLDNGADPSVCGVNGESPYKKFNKLEGLFNSDDVLKQHAETFNRIKAKMKKKNDQYLCYKAVANIMFGGAVVGTVAFALDMSQLIAIGLSVKVAPAIIVGLVLLGICAQIAQLRLENKSVSTENRQSAT